MNENIIHTSFSSHVLKKVPEANNDNARKTIMAVGFEEDMYIDVYMNIQESGLPFHLAFAETSEDADYYLNQRGEEVVAVLAHHHMNDCVGHGLKWLNNRKHTSMANIPTIAVVNNEKQASFTQKNAMCDATIVARNENIMDSITLFNALADATANSKHREPSNTSQKQSHMFLA